MTNTLKYYKQLAEAGINDKQAESHIQVVTGIIEDSMATFATKQDIKELEHNLTMKLVFITGSMITFSMGAMTAIMTMIMKMLLRH